MYLPSRELPDLDKISRGQLFYFPPIIKQRESLSLFQIPFTLIFITLPILNLP